MHCNFFNIGHRRLKLGGSVPHSLYTFLVRFQSFLTFFQSSAHLLVLASGMALLELAGNYWKWLVGSPGCLGVLPHPIMPKFCQNNPCNGNYKSKLNKMGLLLNPIVIGTRLCRTSMWSLRKVSGRLYMANHVFLACRVPWVSPMATGVTINH